MVPAVCTLVLNGCGDGGSGPGDTPVPAGVTVSPTSVTFASFGETQQLSATVVDSAGNTIDVGVTWMSSDPLTVAVDNSGLAVAVKNGDVTITATAGSHSGTATASASQTVAGVAVTPGSLILMEGLTDQLTAEAQDARGNAVEGITVTWSSDNAAAATVDTTTGAISGVAAGAAVVTAAAGEIVGSGNVTVVGAADLTLSNGAQPIFSGSCALSGCHTGSNPPQGLNLSAGSTFGNVVGFSSGELPSMNRVTPNEPNQSYLVHKIQGTHTAVGGSGGRMPLGGAALSNQEIAIVRAWILRGAMNN